jgi:hypothetical protein
MSSYRKWQGVVALALIAEIAAPSPTASAPTHDDTQAGPAIIQFTFNIRRPDSEWAFATSFCVGDLEMSGLPKGSVSLVAAHPGFAKSYDLRIQAYAGIVKLHHGATLGPKGNCDYKDSPGMPSAVGGTISFADVKVTILFGEDGQPKQVLLPPGGVKVHLRRSTDNIAPLDGGRLSFLGSDLVMENPEDQITISPASIAGKVRVTAPKARLLDAAILLPGAGTTATTTLDSAGPVSFDLDTATRMASFHEGTLNGSGATLRPAGKDGDLKLANLALHVDQLSWERTSVLAGKDARVVLSKMTVHASSGSYSGPVLAKLTFGKSFSISEVTAREVTHGTAVALGDLLLKEVKANTQDVSVMKPDGQQIAKFQGDVAITEMDERYIAGSFLATQGAVIRSLSSSLSLTDLDVKFDTRSTPTKLGGTVIVRTLPLGSVLLKDIETQWKIGYLENWKIGFQVAARKGFISLYSDASRREELYQTALGSFDAAGTVDLAPPKDSAALHIDKGKLRLNLARINTLKPAVLGGRLVFPKGNLDAENTEPIDVTEEVAAGAIQLTTPAVRVENFAFMLDPAARPASTSATMDGTGITVSASLHQGGFRIIAGN